MKIFGEFPVFYSTFVTAIILSYLGHSFKAAFDNGRCNQKCNQGRNCSCRN